MCLPTSIFLLHSFQPGQSILVSDCSQILCSSSCCCLFASVLRLCLECELSPAALLMAQASSLDGLQSMTVASTGSQVCNLSWSKNVNEIVSTHGYSQNQIIVWKHPTMTKLATLTGHTLRVLYLAVSPDGQTIVTGAGESFSVPV